MAEIRLDSVTAAVSLWGERTKKGVRDNERA